MPLPYPSAELSCPRALLRSSRRRHRFLTRQRRLRWLNGAVAYLDWLILGKPRASLAAAREPRLRGPLTSLQRLAVAELAEDLDVICRPNETYGFIGSGEKISTLRSCVEMMRAETGYGHRPEFGGQDAKLLTATNLSLPAASAQVDLVYPIVPKVVETILNTPGVFRLPVALEPPVLPSLFVNVSSWLPIAISLCESGLLMPLDDHDVPRTSDGRHLRAGLFGVKKSMGEKLRIIVDRRRMNSCEYSLREVVARQCILEKFPLDVSEGLRRLFVLPHPEQFRDLLLTAGSVMHFNLKDCTNYYYLMRLPDHLAKTNVVAWSVNRDEVPSSLLEEHGVPRSATRISFCLRAPAMGAKQSTELAQCVHQMVLQQPSQPECAVQHEDNWLSLGWPPPNGNEWCGAYIDDLGHVCVVPSDVPEYPREAALNLAEKVERLSTEAYARSRFIVKPEKCKRSSDQAKIWGGLLNSDRGDLGGPPERMACLAEVTRLLVLCGHCCTRDVERVLGLWTHFLAFYRPSMCLFSETYAWLQKGKESPWMQRRIPPEVHDEFVGAMILWPWCRTKLRACIADQIVATDATLTQGGVAVSPLTVDQAVSLWSRQRWRKGALSYVGEGLPEEELFISSSPMLPDRDLELAIQTLQFARVTDYRYRTRSHVNIQELLAWRTGVRWIANDPARRCTRVLQLIDSQVCVHIISKGRSSSKRLNNIMQSALGHLLLGRIYPQPLWVSSWANPSDELTRGRSIRTAVPLSGCECPDFFDQAEAWPWPLAANRAEWKRRGLGGLPTDNFDATKGYPGEGPRVSPRRSSKAVGGECNGVNKTKLSTDLRIGVKAETQRYVQRVQEFDRWLASESLPSVDSLVRSDEFKALNAALVALLQSWSDRDYPTSHGSFLLAGLQFVHPMLKGHLQAAWSALRHWQNLAPPTIRSPMPAEFLLACSTTLWVYGMQRTACALLLGYHTLLRPLELASIQRKHLMLRADLGARYCHGVVSVPQSKTATRFARLQAVTIDDPLVLSLVEAIVQKDMPHHLLVPGGLRSLQQRYQWALKLMDCAQCGFGLSSLRGGGATEFMLRTQNVSALQFRGRWASAATIQHYVQVSLGAATMERLPALARQRVQLLADLAPHILCPAHVSLVTPESVATPGYMGTVQC
eukprot:791763-Amphidinium_carterae.1